MDPPGSIARGAMVTSEGTNHYLQAKGAFMNQHPAVSIVLVASVLSVAEAQRPEPEVVGTAGGDETYKVLEVGAIPAIDDPAFAQGEEAHRQMRPDEPVLGIVLRGEARAHSLWQLDADSGPGRPRPEGVADGCVGSRIVGRGLGPLVSL
jgi:hypothetical protein